MAPHRIAALVAAALSLTTGCAAAAGSPPPDERAVARCTWSYFGDPRAVVHAGALYTGCIGVDGRTAVEELDLATGFRRVHDLFGRLEVDDHNNPSLASFRGRLFAFSTPHSGYVYPRSRRSRMRYRVRRPDGSWAPPRTVPLSAGCGLGYTYPNPVVSGDRLYLFMRGPCWEPTFTWTEDGRTWAPERTLVSAPDPALQDAGGDRRVRPYAKYAAGADGSIHVALSDGHPVSFPAGLAYARLRRDGLYAADGRRIARLGELPVPVASLDRVAAPSADDGRAWPMDVAEDGSGAPVILYSALRDAGNQHRHARWDGARWRTRVIAATGSTDAHFHGGGATFDHADPDRIVLSRVVGGEWEVELRRTADGGATWATEPVTREPGAGFSVRPVIPRGWSDPAETLVLYVRGTATGWRDFDTSVVMRRHRIGSAHVPVARVLRKLDPVGRAAL